MRKTDPLQSPRAAALLRDREALNRLLTSPEAKRLTGLLSAQEAEALRSAAQRARQGDPSALSSAARSLLSRPEAAALLRSLERRLPGKG